jgi:multidrug efflux pump
MSGLKGQFYKQFAMTIAVSTVISAFNSLTLSPALSALLLKGHHEPKEWLGRGMNKVLGPFFAAFNVAFRRARDTAAAWRASSIARSSFLLSMRCCLG